MPTPIDAIRPHPRNPRRITSDALAKLRESIQRDPEFMRLRPIVVDADGQILGGNQRWKACKALGFDELPDGWVVKADDLTDEQRRRFILVDNAPEGMAGGWDFDLLKTDWNLPELKELGFDLGDLGVEPEGEADAEAQIDRAEELNQKWGVKDGDLWLVGEHRLLCGDSTKAEDVAKALNETPVSMIHADPPYFGKVDEAWDNEFKGYEQFLDFLDSVFALWIPKTMDRGTSAWWCAPDFAWHIEERLRKYAAVFNHIVWTKGKSLGTTVSVEDMRRWRPRSERLLLCEKQHSPDALLASFNAKTAHIAARSAYSSIIDRLVGWLESSGLSLKQIDACLGTNGMGGHYFGRSQWSLPTKEAWDKLRPLFSSKGVDIGEWDAQRAEFDAQRREFDAQRREFDAETADNLTDVWEMSAPTGEERPDHPTPKPLALVSKLLSAHTRPEDLIADPFLGSGTTMVAAHNLSRKCYGLEISPAYCAVILQRMADAFPGIDIRRG